MKTHTLHKHLHIFGIDRELEIAFTIMPGSPETGPSYDSGGEPAHGPEIEIASVRVCIPATRMLPERWEPAGDWLVDAVQECARHGLYDDFIECVEVGE